MHFESNASNAASSARSPRQPLRLPDQLIADGHMSARPGEPSVGMIGGLDSTGPSNELCREQRGNALIWNDRSAAA
jgi:hypothetical protein